MVDHDVLLDVMWDSGIRGLAYQWFKSYLSERKQCVRVGDQISEWGILRVGVPQGTI